MNKNYALLVLAATTFYGSCTTNTQSNQETIDDIAEAYVKLCLEIGKYDNAFVDAYYGPEHWKSANKAKKIFPYQELKWQAKELVHRMELIDPASCSSAMKLRRNFITKQLNAVSTRLDILSGKRLPFDFEAYNLYDIVPTHVTYSHFESLINSLEELVPGEGLLTERYLAYSEQFIIPSDKLETVFTTAINEAKKRVSQKIKLPENEKFELSYVTDQPWSGYNWYQGNYNSLIQINTDLPIYIDRAIDLACHEGYPGHHVYNVMLEKNLVNKNGWKEMTIYPLFSPQSFVAEGSANYGIKMAFPDAQRLTYEKEVLFPLAGIDPNLADKYYKILEIRKQLNFVEINIARDYLESSISKEEATALIQKYLLYSEERAEQRLNFYSTYRSYVINYTLGEQMIKEFVEGFGDSPNEHWNAFNQLLSFPKTASVL